MDDDEEAKDDENAQANWSGSFVFTRDETSVLHQHGVLVLRKDSYVFPTPRRYHFAKIASFKLG